MNNSIILLGIFLVIGVNCGEKDIPEGMKKLVKACMEDLEITQEEYEEAARDNSFASNPKFHCMPECVMRKAEILVDKKVNLEKLKASTKEMHPDISDEDIEKINEQCLGEAEGNEDNCDFVHKYEMCSMSEYHKKD